MSIVSPRFRLDARELPCHQGFWIRIISRSSRVWRRSLSQDKKGQRRSTRLIFPIAVSLNQNPMQKTPYYSQSGSFNPRALLAFLLGSLGVFLAVASFRGLPLNLTPAIFDRDRATQTE